MHTLNTQRTYRGRMFPCHTEFNATLEILPFVFMILPVLLVPIELYTALVVSVVSSIGYFCTKNKLINHYIDNLSYPIANKMLLGELEIFNFTLKHNTLFSPLSFEAILETVIAKEIHRPWYANDQDTLRDIINLVRRGTYETS